MTITNKTQQNLTILGGILKPEETKKYAERAFYILDIHAEVGSCVITTEYGKRKFKNFGKLVAKEGEEQNAQGIKNIIVQQIA